MLYDCPLCRLSFTWEAFTAHYPGCLADNASDPRLFRGGGFGRLADCTAEAPADPPDDPYFNHPGILPESADGAVQTWVCPHCSHSQQRGIPA